MPTTNFSTEEAQVFSLALDLARNDYSLSDGVTKADLENHLRETINNDLLGGKTLYQAMRRNKIAIFEIVEEIVTTAIGENVMDSPFMDSFVEFKNRALGDNTAFYSEGGLLTVSRFAGNHWDTNRQRLDLGEEFVLPSEWIYVHVYEDLERFLLGITSLDKMMDKIYKSVNKYIQDRIYTQFQSVANSVPAEFAKTGNDEEALGGLCDLIQAAGGYSSLTLAGTKGALRRLAKVVPENQFANSQKEAKAMTGSIGEWDGNKLMTIPQTLRSGELKVALDDTKIFVLGGDVKPIKLELIGDTRTKDSLDGKGNNDMSVDLQVQTKMGCGMVMPNAFGVFTFE